MVFRRVLARTARCTTIYLMLGCTLLLAACGGPTGLSPAARATQTAWAAATRTAQATAATQATRLAAPVWLDLSVAVKGTAEQQNAELDVTVTVTNRTNDPTRIAGSCDNPPILLTIVKTGGGYVYMTGQGVICAYGTGHDLKPVIAAGASYTWTYPIVLATFGYGNVRPGTYRVTAYVHDWHQGTFEDLFKNPPPLHGTASAETTVTVP